MGLLIASQWPDAANAVLRGDGLEVVGVPSGLPADIPREVKVLLLAPPFGWGRSATPAPPGWPFGLEWIQLATSGFDFYPKWLFDSPLVTTARGVSADAIAEFALAAIFSSAKRIPDIWIQRSDQWRQTVLDPIAGSTLGLFGFGAIGQALAGRAIALGMRVRALRRTSTPLGVPGVERASSIEDLFSSSDHVVLAAPATETTQHIVNAHVLRHSKPGLHLINIARGSLIDQPALLAALDDGHVRLATLDVTVPEPLPDGHPLYTHPRVRLSPHTSPTSPDTYERLIRKFRQALSDYTAQRPLADTVRVNLLA
jgi:phosphoglycerate dehydrogenase-like enzyme